MILEWSIPELVATIASLGVGLTLGQALRYVSICVAFIIGIQLARAAIAEVRLQKVKYVYGVGFELLGRTIEVDGSFGVEVINPWRDQWMADFHGYIHVIEHDLRRWMPASKWRKVTSLSAPEDERFLGLRGETVSPKQGKAQVIVAGIVCELEDYINENH